MNNELHSLYRSYNRKSQGTKNQPGVGTNYSPDTKEAKLGFDGIGYGDVLQGGIGENARNILTRKGI